MEGKIMKTSIDIENRTHNNKEVPCYIPKLDGIPVLSGYILKESVNFEGEKHDNEELAKLFLEDKIKEINNFLEKNSKFIKL